MPGALDRRQLLSGLAMLGTGLVTGSVAHSQGGASGEPLDSLWKLPQTGVVELAVTVDGSRVVALNAEGTLQCWDREGDALWSLPLPGTERLLSSRRGSLTLAYASRNADQRRVAFIDGRGRHFFTLELSEPIEAAAVSPDGRFAAVAAGRAVLFCSRTEDGLKYRTLTTPGVPRQVFMGRGDTVYAICGGPEAVLLLKSSGKTLWRHSSANVAHYSGSVSLDGSLLGVAADRTDGNVSVSLMNFGSEVRVLAERPGRRARVRLSGNGRAAVLAYEHRSQHDATISYGRRLAYLGVSGEPGGNGLGSGGVDTWTKGGAFSAPLFVALDRNGRWVVALDTQNPRELPRLRLYGRDGTKRYSVNCAADILIATAAADGSSFATYRRDRQIEFFAVNQDSEFSG